LILCVRGARRHVALPLMAMPLSYVAGQQSAIAPKTYAEGHRRNRPRAHRQGQLVLGAALFAAPAPAGVQRFASSGYRPAAEFPTSSMNPWMVPESQNNPALERREILAHRCVKDQMGPNDSDISWPEFHNSSYDSGNSFDDISGIYCPNSTIVRPFLSDFRRPT
jgi:hypothetical protein